MAPCKSYSDEQNEEIRAMVYAEIRRTGATQRHVAAIAGVSPATLSAFLVGLKGIGKEAGERLRSLKALPDWREPERRTPASAKPKAKGRADTDTLLSRVCALEERLAKVEARLRETGDA